MKEWLDRYGWHDVYRLFSISKIYLFLKDDNTYIRENQMSERKNGWKNTDKGGTQVTWSQYQYEYIEREKETTKTMYKKNKNDND
jgi:hypothetical protein